LLIPKAQAALERYGHSVVIANELHRRKFEVAFVYRTHAKDPSAPRFAESWIRIDLEKTPEKEIEEDIVEGLVKRHNQWVDM
jgi:phosphopantothenate---cysteine ligase (ATP)